MTKDLESNGTPMLEPTIVDEERMFLFRTGKEWLEALPGFTSVTMLVFSILYWSDCSGIPTLPYYGLAFAIVQLANSLIGLIFRLNRRKAAGEKPGPVQHISSLLGISTLGLAIWGAVLTFPEVHRFSDPGDCAAALYTMGFISAAIVVAIMGLLLVVGLPMYLCMKAKAEAATDVKDAVAASPGNEASRQSVASAI